MYKAINKTEKNLIAEGLRIVNIDANFIITQKEQIKLRQHLGDIYCGGCLASIELFQAMVTDKFELEQLQDEMYGWDNPDC